MEKSYGCAQTKAQVQLPTLAPNTAPCQAEVYRLRLSLRPDALALMRSDISKDET